MAPSHLNWCSHVVSDIGGPSTNGFLQNLGSIDASSTSKTSSERIAHVQKEMSRGVSRVPSRPVWDLNHWRPPSTSEINAMGISAANRAARVSESKKGSGSESRMFNERKADRRSCSITGVPLWVQAEMAKRVSTFPPAFREPRRIRGLSDPPAWEGLQTIHDRHVGP